MNDARKVLFEAIATCTLMLAVVLIVAIIGGS